jgi:hypothetical protein
MAVRVMLIVLFFAALGACGFYYLHAQDLERQVSASETHAKDLETRIQQWEGLAYQQWLKKQEGSAVNDSLIARTAFLDPLELDELERKGLSDPVVQIKADLAAHPELIPYTPTMGGTMRFTGPATVILLAGGFAHARFEDGHVSGECLLEFSVKPGAPIEWKRIAAHLD